MKLSTRLKRFRDMLLQHFKVRKILRLKLFLLKYFPNCKLELFLRTRLKAICTHYESSPVNNLIAQFCVYSLFKFGRKKVIINQTSLGCMTQQFFFWIKNKTQLKLVSRFSIINQSSNVRIHLLDFLSNAFDNYTFYLQEQGLFKNQVSLIRLML